MLSKHLKMNKAAKKLKDFRKKNGYYKVGKLISILIFPT